MQVNVGNLCNEHGGDIERSVMIANGMGIEGFNPFHPDCKTVFWFIIYKFSRFFPFLRPDRDCYVIFASFST